MLAIGTHAVCLLGAFVYCWFLWRMRRLRAREQFFSKFHCIWNPTQFANFISLLLNFQLSDRVSKQACSQNVHVHVFRSVPFCTMATPLEIWQKVVYFRVVRIMCCNPSNYAKKTNESAYFTCARMLRPICWHSFLLLCWSSNVDSCQTDLCVSWLLRVANTTWRSGHQISHRPLDHHHSWIVSWSLSRSLPSKYGHQTWSATS